MANIVKVRNRTEIEEVVVCGHLTKGACAKCVIRAFDEATALAVEKGKYMALNNLIADELTDQDFENIRFNTGR